MATQMTDETDELIQAVEGARNFMVGMAFDPRLPSEIKSALHIKADELDSLASTVIARYES